MSRTISRRLLAHSPCSGFIKASPAPRLPLRCHPFSNIPRRTAEDDEGTPAPKSSSTSPTPIASTSPTDSKRSFSGRSSNAKPASPSLHPNASTFAPSDGIGGILSAFGKIVTANQYGRAARRQTYDPFLSSDGSLISSQAEKAETHHFHIYALRHNTHITVTRPDRSPLISVSCGNIGFRHSGRKHYDSAFQLASYVLGRMNESGLTGEIQRLEVVLRGYGAGREAVTKALLGTEGRFLRPKVVKVADATRLKFGGTRSKKPRRLG